MNFQGWWYSKEACDMHFENNVCYADAEKIWDFALTYGVEGIHSELKAAVRREVQQESRIDALEKRLEESAVELNVLKRRRCKMDRLCISLEGPYVKDSDGDEFPAKVILSYGSGIVSYYAAKGENSGDVKSCVTCGEQNRDVVEKDLRISCGK